VWQRLLTDMMLGILLPALAGLIALARLLWIGVASGLKSLERLAHDLKSRSSASLAAITLRNTPSELFPVVKAVNGLLT
jgi:two-component system sensor histidine kinase QseC